MIPWMLMKLLGLFIFIVLLFFGLSWWLYGPAASLSKPGVFAVPQNRDGYDVAIALEDKGYIKSAGPFGWLLNVFGKGKEVAEGGFRLDPTMNSWQVMKALTGPPQLLWVTTSGCIRKEQVGEILAKTLGWSNEELLAWNTVYTETKPEYTEGVYFPDTYLVPTDQKGDVIAGQFTDNFNTKFAPLLDTFTRKNIKWTTGLKIASLIQREAAGPEDMKLISGIIWNRLDQGIKLEIDATMQYTRGKVVNPSTGAVSWWGSIDLTQKKKDSPYNSYLHKGLPPTPICSPGLDAIRAVIEPEQTDCIFYLHDKNRQIHCAKTYAGHLLNIDTYLR